MIVRALDSKRKPWKWALTAAVVGGVSHLLLYSLTLFAGLQETASILQFFLPGNIGPLLLDAVVPTSVGWMATGLSDIVTVAANLFIFAGMGVLLHWLRGRPRYLYVLPLLAIIGCWAAQLYLLSGISSRRLTGKATVTITAPSFRPALLNDVVIGVTTYEKLIALLGEPTCLQHEDSREILIYRELRLSVRRVREQYGNETDSRRWLSNPDDDATEILHVIVVSEGKVAAMRTDDFELMGRDSREFPCDLLSFDE